MDLNKRTRALDISKAVKQRVYQRDGGLCVICRRPGAPNAHYVSRAQGGLGIDENILTLCSDCHRAYDQSPMREHIKRDLTAYLRSKYKDWDNIRLTYRKGI